MKSVALLLIVCCCSCRSSLPPQGKGEGYNKKPISAAELQHNRRKAKRWTAVFVVTFITLIAVK